MFIAAADAAISPSQPKIILTLALATVLGFLISCLITLTLSFRAGFCYTERAVLDRLNQILLLKYDPFVKTDAELLQRRKTASTGVLWIGQDKYF